MVSAEVNEEQLNRWIVLVVPIAKYHNWMSSSDCNFFTPVCVVKINAPEKMST